MKRLFVVCFVKRDSFIAIFFNFQNESSMRIDLSIVNPFREGAQKKTDQGWLVCKNSGIVAWQGRKCHFERIVKTSFWQFDEMRFVFV